MDEIGDWQSSLYANFEPYACVRRRRRIHAAPKYRAPRSGMLPTSSSIHVACIQAQGPRNNQSSTSLPSGLLLGVQDTPCRFVFRQ